MEWCGWESEDWPLESVFGSPAAWEFRFAKLLSLAWQSSPTLPKRSPGRAILLTPMQRGEGGWPLERLEHSPAACEFRAAKLVARLRPRLASGLGVCLRQTPIVDLGVLTLLDKRRNALKRGRFFAGWEMEDLPLSGLEGPQRLGSSLTKTPIRDLALLTDSPKSNPEELMLLGVLFWE